MAFLDDLAELISGQINEIFVCDVPRDIAKVIGSRTQLAYLSSQTLYKQQKHHQDITFSDYSTLPQHMDMALILHESGQRQRLHYLYNRSEGQRYVTTLKSTNDGQRMYVVRFHKARRRQTNPIPRNSAR